MGTGPSPAPRHGQRRERHVLQGSVGDHQDPLAGHLLRDRSQEHLAQASRLLPVLGVRLLDPLTAVPLVRAHAQPSGQPLVDALRGAARSPPAAAARSWPGPRSRRPTGSSAPRRGRTPAAACPRRAPASGPPRGSGAAAARARRSEGSGFGSPPGAGRSGAPGPGTPRPAPSRRPSAPARWRQPPPGARPSRRTPPSAPARASADRGRPPAEGRPRPRPGCRAAIAPVPARWPRRPRPPGPSAGDALCSRMSTSMWSSW